MVQAQVLFNKAIIQSAKPSVSARLCLGLPSDNPITRIIQIPPRDGHPCSWLVVPATEPTADFHRLAFAHAEQ
jgi:hypothetical protein